MQLPAPKTERNAAEKTWVSVPEQVEITGSTPSAFGENADQHKALHQANIKNQYKKKKTGLCKSSGTEKDAVRASCQRAATEKHGNAAE